MIFDISTIELYNNRGCVIYLVRVCVSHNNVFKILVVS